MKPARTLIRYGLVALNGGGPYLAGLQDHGGRRTSTPLVELDLAAGTAVTASGRPYVLQGQPDAAFGLEVALSVWRSYFNMTGADVVALSPEEAVSLMSEKGNAPFTETLEERQAIARRYGVRLDEEGDVVGPDWVIPDPVEGEDDEDIRPWGSGNVFRDLGLPDPEEDEPYPVVGIVPEVKATAILSIRDLMRQRGLSMEEAAGIVGMDADRLRAIVDGRKVGGVSLERLGGIVEAVEMWAAGQGRKP
jgi:hypothetical protein